MELVEIRRLDDCLDGALQFSCRFDGAVTEAMVRALAAGERLDYHPDFPRPFFRIFFASGAQVKGVVGDVDMLVLFPSGGGAGENPDLEKWLRKVLPGL